VAFVICQQFASSFENFKERAVYSTKIAHFPDAKKAI